MKKFDEIKRMVDLVREINESIQNDNELLVETNPLGVAAKEGAITAKMLEPLFKDLMVAGRKEATLLAKAGVKDSEGLLKLIQNDFKQVDVKLGTLAKNEARQVRAGLELSILKNSSGVNKELLDVAASNLVKDSRFLETYRQYGNETDLVYALKKNGYSDQGAKSIAKERFNPKQTKVEPKPVDSNLPLPFSPPVPKWWNFDWTRNKKWFKRALVVAGVGTTLGGIYLAWKTFFGDDDDLPPCLKVLIKDENEFQNYLATGFVIMGNYKFYQDKKVELTSTSGVVEGEWSYNSGNKTIDLDFDGRKTSIPCVETAPPEISGWSKYPCVPDHPRAKKAVTSTGGLAYLIDGEYYYANGRKKTSDGKMVKFNCNEPPFKENSDGGTTYRFCPGPKFVKNCINDKIKEVQRCLGLVDDGKFGPKTQYALESKGFYNGFTDDDVSKICKGEDTGGGGNRNPYTDWQPQETEG